MRAKNKNKNREVHVKTIIHTPYTGVAARSD